MPAELLQLGVPVLGICYGMQWMARTLGGEVQPSHQREFGRQAISVRRALELFDGVTGHTVVWMSHGDSVTRMPQGFEVYAETPTCPIAAMGDPARRLYGVQFHPEVTHTVRGRELLENFVSRVCELSGDWRPESIVEREVRKVREIVGDDGEVVLGLSGGVDSSVAALIVHQAIGAPSALHLRRQRLAAERRARRRSKRSLQGPALPHGPARWSTPADQFL